MRISLITFDVKGDDRGGLVVLENSRHIPFEIKRVYYLFHTLSGVRRGFHAHTKLQQVAICISGSCEFLLDDGYSIETVKLDNNYTGLMLPPMVWHEMFNFSSDCVLLVLANEYYNEADYIRSYQDFTREVGKNKINSTV